jgi:plastocyanin
MRALRWIPRVAVGGVLLGAIAVTAFLFGDTGGAGAASSSREVTVRAGVNAAKDPTIAVTEFLPAKITVRAGTTVDWSWKGAIEPHSVTFLAPDQELPPPGSDLSLFGPTPPTGPYTGDALVNSGLQPIGTAKPAPFELTFPDAGKFSYYCVIHPNMVGQVNVVRRGEPDTQAEITRRGKSEQRKWVAEGIKAKRKLERDADYSRRNADGSRTWSIQMGTTTEHTDVLAFARTPKRIRAGDSVKFVNSSLAPHTATYVGEQQPITDPLSEQATNPAPGPSPQTLNQTDLFNTGELPPNAPGGPAGRPPPKSARSYTWVVPEEGTYPYYCILHTLSGMGGEIRAR